MTLNELTYQYLELLEEFTVRPDDLDLATELSKVDASIEEKADAYAAVIDYKKSTQAMHDGTAKYYQERYKTCKEASNVAKNQAERMQECLLDMMIETGKTDFKTDNHAFKVINNGGKQPIEFVMDAGEVFSILCCKDRFGMIYNALNSAFVEYFGMNPFIFKVEWDKTEIRNALEDGCQFKYAYLKDRGKKAKIK